jgi:hypothetical protein
MSTPPPPSPPPWSWRYESGRRPPGRNGLRVSDAERNAMAELLSKHYADGRLDDEEFKERVDRAMSAKTESDFYGLTDDLPRLDAAGPAPLPVRRRRPLTPLLGVLLVLAIVSWWLPSMFLFPHHVGLLLLAVFVLLLWRRHSWRSWQRYHSHSHPAAHPFG